MRIATFNVNGVNGRLEVLLKWLDEQAPDVVCLQELKAPQAKFPAAAIERASYGAVWQGQSRWNGVAILARDAELILTRRGLPGEPEDEQARYIEAAVRGGADRLPLRAERQSCSRSEVRLQAPVAGTAACPCCGAPVVLAGDYNVIPGERDVYAPERWRDDALFRTEVQQAFARLLAQSWTDALRACYPQEQIYTFWDYLRHAWRRDTGLRLDHLLLGPAVADRLVEAGVDREVRGYDPASDHAPAWIAIAA
jgi:exodeoxyribonuclease III